MNHKEEGFIFLYEEIKTSKNISQGQICQEFQDGLRHMKVLLICFAYKIFSYLLFYWLDSWLIKSSGEVF